MARRYTLSPRNRRIVLQSTKRTHGVTAKRCLLWFSQNRITVKQNSSIFIENWCLIERFSYSIHFCFSLAFTLAYECNTTKFVERVNNTASSSQFVQNAHSHTFSVEGFVACHVWFSISRSSEIKMWISQRHSYDVHQSQEHVSSQSFYTW